MAPFHIIHTEHLLLYSKKIIGAESRGGHFYSVERKLAFSLSEFHAGLMHLIINSTYKTLAMKVDMAIVATLTFQLWAGDVSSSNY